MEHRTSRRRFIEAASLTGAGLILNLPRKSRGAESLAKPASLGGPKAHPGGFPSWPIFDATEEQALLDTLKSGQWFRGTGKDVARFEDEFKELTGAKRCLATACGTAALTTALGAMDLGPGDEVIIPPYTFIATFNCVTMHYALPIFVDTDPATFQIDATKIESAITAQTRAILPVHIGGSPADLDKIMEIANGRNLPVIEDACQAHLAEWRGRKVGTYGLAGCFSFQASKNLTSGEGGAVLTDDDKFADACYSFHYQGVRGQRLNGKNSEGSGTRGANLRLSEFQGALLVAQMTRLADQTNRRVENAAYLTELLREIPGIHPAGLHDGTTRSAWHLYMFRYEKERFAGLDRAGFLRALNAEGVPASGGYAPMNGSEFVKGLAHNRHYLGTYGEKRMKDWIEQTNACPQNEKLCSEAVWFTQNMLLGSREDMEQIAQGVRKIQDFAGELAKR